MICYLAYSNYITTGEFGKVHRGWLREGDANIEVAIKESKGLFSWVVAS